MLPGAHASASNQWRPERPAKRWLPVATTAPWTFRSAQGDPIPDDAVPNLRRCDPSIEGTSYRRSPLETSSDPVKNLDYPLDVANEGGAAWGRPAARDRGTTAQVGLPAARRRATACSLANRLGAPRVSETLHVASSRPATLRTTVVRSHQRRGSIAERVENAVSVVPDPLRDPCAPIPVGGCESRPPPAPSSDRGGSRAVGVACWCACPSTRASSGMAGPHVHEDLLEQVVRVSRKRVID
jgi:hypothetical protein